MNTIQKFIARLRVLSDRTKTNIVFAVAILTSLLVFFLWVDNARKNFEKLSLNEPMKTQKINLQDLAKEIKKGTSILTQNLQQSFAFLTNLMQKEEKSKEFPFPKEIKPSSPPPLLPLSD